jgi:aldehyde:ferredoxin oxidoreductase
MSIRHDGAYGGKILRVDLSSSTVAAVPTAEYAERWVGGRPVNTWFCFDEMEPDISWDDPDSLLCFGTGVLVGTLAPGSCRVSVECKNVFNGGMGSSNVGGFWGPELKYAGYDHIIIKGRSEKLVYLWIHDEEVEIVDAAELSGCTTWETEAWIRDFYHDERIRVASIGPAGEHLVKSACIINDRAGAAGGSGCGAVMGSKKLKAIAVRGTGKIRVAEPKRFMAAVDKTIKNINSWKYVREIREKGYYGALGGLLESKGWEEGYRPVRNGQDEYWGKEKIAKICEEVISAYRVGTVACFGCPTACKPWTKIEKGKYAIEGEGWWNNSSNAFCTKIDNTDIESAIYAHHLTNQLGLDLDNAAQAISWAYEAYEKGFLTTKDTDGLELNWGNAEAMISLFRKIALREGFGDFLADGSLAAAEKLGRGKEFAIHIKGQDSLDGVRINKGWGFGIVVSPVSGRHLRGSLGSFWLTRGDAVNSYDDVPEELVFGQKKKAIQDTLGTCSYVYGQTLENWIEMYESITGSSFSEDDFLFLGLQAHNVEKAFNTLHAGFDRKDDYPCERYYNEPVASGPYKGERIDHKIWNDMLDEYYRLHEWDQATGLQTFEGLSKIGLKDVAERLKKAGKIK